MKGGEARSNKQGKQIKQNDKSDVSTATYVSIFLRFFAGLCIFFRENIALGLSMQRNAQKNAITGVLKKRIGFISLKVVFFS
jgi:hypothetical protein